MKKKEEEQIDESWMATYGDMVTLLMCFFVLMMAVSKVDMALYEQVQSGMNKGVGKEETPRPIEMMIMELTDEVQSLKVEDNVSLGSDIQGVFVDIDGEMLFKAGSAEITPKMKDFLKRVAATLMSEKYKNFIFSVNGHTSDEEFSSYQYPSNWELSSARASSVVRLFEERGMPRSRLKASGMYDTAPKLPNTDPFGEAIPYNRRKNNRVTIYATPSFK
ncbi:MAG: flagellar motor protein MotB [Alphaproteobacteria bacterium]